MTETCVGPQGDAYRDDMNIGIRMAEQITRSLVQAEHNAWIFWRFLSHPGNTKQRGAAHGRENLLAVDYESKTCALSIKYYILGHFSKFVRPGYVRVDADTGPTTGVLVSAFRSPDSDRLVWVAVNTGEEAREIRFDLKAENGEFDAVYVWRTSESESMRELGGEMTDAKFFKTSLPPHSVGTFVAALLR
jgi:glucuronoarabinoxylan endo-1,4-beta-xylanase